MRTRLAVFAAIVVAAVLGFGSSAPMGAEAAGPGTWTAAANAAFAQTDTESVLLRNGSVLFAGGDDGVGLAPRGQVYNPITNAWSTTGLLGTPREQASLTLLRDGRVLLAGGFDASSTGVTSTELYSPGTNGWTPGPPMIAPAMIGHTATLLPDGRVLVTGGLGGSATDQAQLFDPVANSWSAAASMSGFRSGHSAVLLQNGRVLIAGGQTTSFGPPLAVAEIYNPATNTWSPAASMTTARGAFFTMNLLPGGNVLVAGGVAGVFGGSIFGAEVYDPVANTWTPTGAMATNRAAHRAVLLGNGKVLVSGGGDGSTEFASTELYDPATNNWSPSGSMSMSRSFHTMTLLHDGRTLSASDGAATTSAELYDATAWRATAVPASMRGRHTATLLWSGKVLVAGGEASPSSAETFDPVPNTWAVTGSLAAGRHSHSATLLKNGKVLIVGGFSTAPFGVVPTAELYDPVAGTWTAAASPGIARYSQKATLLPDGRVLVAGGIVETAPGSFSYFPTTSTELYDPATNSWSPGAPMLVHHGSAGVAGVVAGRVVMAGGWLCCSTYGWALQDGFVEAYDPGLNAWTALPPIAARANPGGTVLSNGKFAVFGGTNLLEAPPPPGIHIDLPVTTTQLYDPFSNSWSTLAPMPLARAAMSVLELYDGRIIVVGSTISADLFQPATNLWTTAGVTSAFRSNGVLLTDGRVLATGNTGTTTADTYDLGIHTDTDGDGYNDGLELALGQHPWLNCKTMRADVSGDGLINVADLGRVASKVGVRPPPSRIDQNGDKVVNVADLGLVASKSGQSVLGCA